VARLVLEQLTQPESTDCGSLVCTKRDGCGKFDLPWLTDFLLHRYDMTSRNHLVKVKMRYPMKPLIRKQIVFSSFAMLLFPLVLAATKPVTISVNALQPGAEISPNFLGLSYESSLMLPSAHGVHYFRPGNKPLVAMFKTLGVRSLRIGGASVDSPNIPLPNKQDVTALFDFAQAAGAKVIYSVRLRESTRSGGLRPSTSASNAQYAATLAGLIHDRYADVLACFSIGNEPYYFKDYSVYSIKWKAIHDAILTLDPHAEFCGLDQNPAAELDKQMVREFSNGSGRLVMINQHSYPVGCAYKNPQARSDTSSLVPFNAAESRDKMLSAQSYNIYDRIYKGIEGAIAGTSVSYSLTEVNSFWFSGLKGASDSYASALWGVDFLYWWAYHGASGINFHSGDRTGGQLSMPCRYAAFVTSGHGYQVRPLGYGMKLFDFGGHGEALPVTAPSAAGLVAYATLEGKEISVTLINKTHGSEARKQAVQVRLDVPLATSSAQVIFLRARDNDIGDSLG
jgi:hypothetical protein